MPSTYTTSLRTEQQADGENAGTWGQKGNLVFQLLEDAIATGAAATIDCAGSSDVTLTSNSGTADQSRRAILRLSGVLTGAISVIVPTAAVKSKWYIVSNETTGSFALTFKAQGGTGIVVPQGEKGLFYCDATNIVDLGFARRNNSDTFAVGGGTADAITATMAPITVLKDGMEHRVRAPGANTLTNPTYAPNSLTARTITKQGGSALVAGDYVSGQELLLRYVSASTSWELINPKKVASADVSGGGTVSSIADATNGGVVIAGTSSVPTIALLPSDLTAKATRAAADSFVINDVAGSNVAKKITYLNALSGMPIQTVSTVTGAVASCTTRIPIDDTIPQSTEGDQVMSLAITPISATSTLVITVTAYGANSASSTVPVAALFRDAGTDALAVGGWLTAGGAPGTSYHCVASASSTSATTFKVRVGADSGTVTFNGTAGGRLYGGVFASSIVISEYLP